MHYQYSAHPLEKHSSFPYYWPTVMHFYHIHSEGETRNKEFGLQHLSQSAKWETDQRLVAGYLLMVA